MTIDVRCLTRFKDVREAAYVTSWKPLESLDNKEDTRSIILNYLISEHSPIRSFVIRVYFNEIPKRVAGHLVRHVHALSFMSSSRPDWFPDKASTDVVNLIQDYNAQALIDMSRKRLCHRAYEDTRKVVETLKAQLLSSCSIYYQALGFVMVPNCIYRCGCPEPKSCGLFERFKAFYKGEDICSDILDRYDKYATFLILG